MTHQINFSGNNRFAILPEVLGYGQGGPLARLYIVPIPADVKPGTALSLEQLAKSGALEKGTVMTFDNPLSLSALHQQVGRAYNHLCREILLMENIREAEEAARVEAEKAAEPEQVMSREDRIRAHVVELAKMLNEPHHDFNMKFGIPNRGPNHAHNYDHMSLMHQPRQEVPQNSAEKIISQALANALGTDAGSVKVVLQRPASNVIQPGLEDLDPLDVAEGLIEVLSNRQRLAQEQGNN